MAEMDRSLADTHTHTQTLPNCQLITHLVTFHYTKCHKYCVNVITKQTNFGKEKFPNRAISALRCLSSDRNRDSKKRNKKCRTRKTNRSNQRTLDRQEWQACSGKWTTSRIRCSKIWKR